MAKTPPKRKGRRTVQTVPEAELPRKENYYIIVAGVVVAIVGMLVMHAGGTVDPLSVAVAPLILVLGYCVIVPIGILYRRKAAAKTGE